MDIQKRLELFISELKKEEQKNRSKMMFCKEHNFNKEYEHINAKVKILNEIRLEAELIIEAKEYRPKFYFND